MSQLTNYGENKLADFLRGSGITLPAAWHIQALSAYSDSSFTQVTSIGLSRVSYTRSLANWAGTQGDGTTLVSTGTTHTTSNNNAIDLGDATGSATITALGLFDASSGGNCWMVWELETPLSVVNTDPVVIEPAQLKFSLGVLGGLSDYLANKLIDLLFRNQSYTYPTSIFHGLYTSGPSNAGGGTEVGGGVGYARAELVVSTTNISGTQGPGTTSASSGTDGRISNNVEVSHPVPAGSWGTPPNGGWHDASSGGNLLYWRALGRTQSIGLGSPAPTFAPDDMGWTLR